MDSIGVAYQPTDIEVNVLEGTNESHSDWSANKYNEFKQNLKQHYRSQQDNRCCYCKKELGFDLKETEIEHILAKSAYPQFMFEVQNLAISCPGCNVSKGSVNVLLGNTIPKKYPCNPKHYAIVHPHFDYYSDHIQIVDNVLFAPLTEKGIKTIQVCKLHRLSKVMAQSNQKQTKQTDANTLMDTLTAMDDAQRRDLKKFLRAL